MDRGIINTWTSHDENATLYNADCLESMKLLPDCSIDSIVTDPPYELGFMGKSWDNTGIAYNVDLWEECLRVLKPGGHLLSFGGSRTYHRMTCAIEDAGFEIRDQIMWVYGSGFPKSLDVSKAIDKAAGADREVLGKRQFADGTYSRSTAMMGGDTGKFHGAKGNPVLTAPATEQAKQWSGWGTALKPAHEPICVARKPFKGTVADNVLNHGTGAINIDGCRIVAKRDDANIRETSRRGKNYTSVTSFKARPDDAPGRGSEFAGLGRFPANFIHDGSEEVVRLFPDSTSTGGSGPASKEWKGPRGQFMANIASATGGFGDSGSAARFFYCAKASRADRNDGDVDNIHPTVKPTDLMRYLCRLVTPKGGTVLDPFTGSGSTGKACMREGFKFIGIEKNAEYFEIAKKRIRAELAQEKLFV